jgi:hypothetical protein
MINPHEHLQFITDHIIQFANADAKLTSLESFKNAIKAIEMESSSQTSISGKEMEAYGSDAYRQWSNDYANAKREFTALKLKIETAKLYIEVWRSQEASNRTTDKTLR